MDVIHLTASGDVSNADAELSRLADSLLELDKLAASGATGLEGQEEVLRDILGTLQDAQRAYDETGDILRDVRKRGDEYGFSVQEQAVSINAVVSASQRSNLSLAKSARVYEELIIETQDAAQAQRLYADALDLVERRGGRVEEQVARLTDASKGQTSALSDLGPRARALASGYDNLRDRQLKNRLVLAAYNKEARRSPDALDKINDRLTIGQAKVAAFVARLGPAGLALGVVGGAAAAATIKLAAFVSEGMDAYIEKSDVHRARSEALAKSYDDLQTSIGGVVVESTGYTVIQDALGQKISEAVRDIDGWRRSVQLASSDTSGLSTGLDGLSFALFGAMAPAIQSTEIYRSMAAALGAAANEAARLRRERAAAAQRTADFETFAKETERELNNPDVRRKALKDRALKLAERQGTPGKIDFVAFPELAPGGELDLEKANKGAGGGGGGKKDPIAGLRQEIAELQRVAKQARALEQLLTSGSNDQIGSRLATLKERYIDVTNEAEAYREALEDTKGKKAKRAILEELGELSNEGSALGGAIEELEEAKAKLDEFEELNKASAAFADLEETIAGGADSIRDKLSEVSREMIRLSFEAGNAESVGLDGLAASLNAEAELLSEDAVLLREALEARQQFQQVNADIGRSLDLAQLIDRGPDAIVQRLKAIGDESLRLRVRITTALAGGFDDVAAAAQERLGQVQTEMKGLQQALPEARMKQFTEQAGADFEKFGLSVADSFGQAAVAGGEGAAAMHESLQGAVGGMVPLLAGLATAYLAAQELNPVALFAATFVLRTLASAASSAFDGSKGRSRSAKSTPTSRRDLQGDNRGDLVINLNARFGTKREFSTEVEGVVNEGQQRLRINNRRRRVG